ncbi:hypothetical protein BpHYR1_005354 [Brachionus plicatilis]|uniref:Uncharacterized protein n=1 Tax=Brachionus plicatilis TaxID=10195 RepID=A0A3M7R559_BRAPC|nr:hypothetical protein BpHYR1_005354 [Brachionus plicatilis]
MLLDILNKNNIPVDMESIKDLAKFCIHYESCCLKIKLNKNKSSTLRCDNFVNMVLKKLENLDNKLELSSAENYGLFESCSGIDMLIPDSRLILQMDNLLENRSHFFIREKNFFELNQNNELTDSVRSQILSYYRQTKKSLRKKSLRLAKSNLVSIKEVEKEVKAKNYIRKTQILKIKLLENVHSKNKCSILWHRNKEIKQSYHIYL